MLPAKLTLAVTVCAATLSLLTAVAHAGNVNAKVNCNSSGAIGKIANVLKRLNPTDTNTVHVSGYCHENVVIHGFDRLSLIAEPGAVIADATSGQASVVDISDSQDVVLQDFTIQGGNNGVYCWDFSFCRLIRLKVEQTGAGGFGGVVVINSQGQLIDSTVQGSSADGIWMFGSKLQWRNVTVSNAQGNGVTVSARSQLNGPNNTVKGSGLAGVYVTNGSNATIVPVAITGNGQSGISVTGGSTLTVGGIGTVVTDNQGAGIAMQGSHVDLFNGLVANNQGGGVVVFWESSLTSQGSTVTNNPNFGVLIDFVSFAYIDSGTFTPQQAGAVDIFCGSDVAVLTISNTQATPVNCPVVAAAARAVPVMPRSLLVPRPPQAVQ